MTPYRIAFIGTGGIVGSHLNAINENRDRIELVAASDLNEERVQAVCAEYNIPRWYTNPTEMLAAEKPDLVHIITPPAPHKTLVVESLEAGAWVFCEKPLCLSLAEFDEIAQAEQRTGRYASTVFQWRFGSAGKHVKHLIETQALGKPLVAVCDTLWYRTQEYYNVPWRGKWATEGGGPTMGHGIHLMDLMFWLLGDWQEVSAMMGTLARDIEVEDVSMAMVRFESGTMASITNSVVSPRQESHLRLDFPRATVEVKALYHYTNEHWRFSLPDNVEDAEAVQAWQGLNENSASRHAVQLREILDSMDTNVRPPVSGLEARRILEFIASLYKSAFTGQVVQRGSITPDDPFYYSLNGSLQQEKQ